MTHRTHTRTHAHIHVDTWTHTRTPPPPPPSARAVGAALPLLVRCPSSLGGIEVFIIAAAAAIADQVDGICQRLPFPRPAPSAAPPADRNPPATRASRGPASCPRASSATKLTSGGERRQRPGGGRGAVAAASSTPAPTSASTPAGTLCVAAAARSTLVGRQLEGLAGADVAHAFARGGVAALAEVCQQRHAAA